MGILFALLLTASLVCFLMAAAGVHWRGNKFSFVALGLALWVLVLVVQTWQTI